MCIGMKILEEATPKLKCTNNTKCWCNKVHFKFPIGHNPEECLSPKEFLDVAGNRMNEHDIKYLKHLSKFIFVPAGEL